MFNWLKKKEYIHKEINIPMIMINNGIDFKYECVVEVASIEIKDSSTKKDVKQAVTNCDISYLSKIPTAYSKNELIKVYTLNGIDNNQRLILAIVDVPDDKPYVLAQNIIETETEDSKKLKSSRLAS